MSYCRIDIWIGRYPVARRVNRPWFRLRLERVSGVGMLSVCAPQRALLAVIAESDAS